MLLTAEFITLCVNSIVEYVPYSTVRNSKCKQQHARMYTDMDCNIHDSYKGKDSQEV
jgi:hypothetical protein